MRSRDGGFSISEGKPLTERHPEDTTMISVRVEVRFKSMLNLLASAEGMQAGLPLTMSKYLRRLIEREYKKLCTAKTK